MNRSDEAGSQGLPASSFLSPAFMVGLIECGCRELSNGCRGHPLKIAAADAGVTSLKYAHIALALANDLRYVVYQGDYARGLPGHRAAIDDGIEA